MDLKFVFVAMTICQAIDFNVVLKDVVDRISDGTVFLLLDNISYRSLNVNIKLSALIATEEEINMKIYKQNQLRGASLTAILILSQNPYSFLSQIEENVNWNPQTLIVISNNASWDTNFILSSSSIKRSEYIYSIESNSDQFVLYTGGVIQPKVLMGNWKKYKDQQNIFKSVYRFHNFQGTNLKVASYCDDFPYLYEETEDDGICIGLSIDILNMLGTKYNFTFNTTIASSDEYWGGFVNNTWNGMFADLQFRGFDITINVFILNFRKAKDFDFTSPFSNQEGFAFFMRNPEANPQWQSIVQPFTLQVWIAILVSTFIMSLLLIVLHWYLDLKNRFSLFMVRIPRSN